MIAGLPPDPDDEAARERTRRRPLGEVTFPVGDAPSIDELARSLAASDPSIDPDAIVARLGLGRGDADALHRRLARAARRVAEREPGPLVEPAVVGELVERQLFGASTLEEYALCSYRWFVQHELRPEQLDPKPEALTQGSVIHGVLEDLYREPPAATGPPPRDPGRLAPEGGRAGRDPRRRQRGWVATTPRRSPREHE